MSYHFEDSLSQFSLSQRELFRRLNWLIQLRWVALFGLALGMLVSHCCWSPFHARTTLFLLTTGVFISLYNLFFMWVYRKLHEHPSSRRNTAFAWLQISIDLALLSQLAFWTGGVHSVFVVFFGVHLAIASVLLKRPHAYGIAAMASVFFDVIAWVGDMGPMAGMLGDGTMRLSRWTLSDDTAPAHTAFLCLVFNTAFLAITYVTSSITERLRFSEEQIENMNRSLCAVNSAKSEFMRTASHEMRSPITAVKGLLHMLGNRIRRNAPFEEVLDLLGRCEGRVTSMGELVEDLLHYSKLRSVQPGESERFDLADVVSGVMEELQPIATTKGLTLDAHAEPCPLEGRRDEIVLLVRNLVGNAVRYTPEGGSIWVRLEKRHAEVVLTVKDTGIGIAEDSLGHVFEEFFRSSEARQFEAGGTGLGLTLCSNIAERHGGTIQVQSECGRGSVFTVWLPLMQPEI